MTFVERPFWNFDHHGSRYAQNWEELVRELHAMDFPLAWSEANGGYWILGAWAEAKKALDDWEAFSADNDVKHERRGGKGSRIPQHSYPLMLSESDPPFHTARRRIEMPFFTPKALREYGPMIDRFMDEALKGIRAKEEADMLRDVILPITARATFHLVGYRESWSEVAYSVHLVSHTKETDPDYPIEMIQRIQAGFRTMVAERRAEPKDDIASALAQGEVLGQPLSFEEAESMMTALVFGGFDTTTASVINALIWLQDRPEIRRQLLDDPALLDNAIEEWLRVWPPAQGIGRTVMRDMEIGGRQLRAGERIFIWFAGANRDPAKFPDPETVQLDRPKASDHLAFSGGGHRCLGAPLAKIELRTMIRAVLTRMPDYRIDLDRVTRFPTYGAVAGYLEVPMRPGAIS